MRMFGERIDAETPELDEEGVRMRFIGRREGVAPELVERMDWAEETTAGNERITLFVAFNYGGRAEIVDAARSFEGDSEEEFRRHLYAPEMHDPDLLIRTSGEQRISNYLLWQCAYSELVFRDELWPDFDREAFEESPGASSRRASAASGARALRIARTSSTTRSFERRAAARATEPPRASRASARPRRRSGARRPSGSSSRSPGSPSRSRSRSPAGSSSPLAMIGIGVLCLREYFAMTGELRPIAASPPTSPSPALIVAAHFGTAFNVLLVLAASFPLLFAFGADRRHRDGITVSMGVTLLGIVWIGIPLVHAVLLRDLPAPRRRAADRRPRRHLRHRHRRLRDRPHVRLATRSPRASRPTRRSRA